MDETKIREIVRDELQRARERRAQRVRGAAEGNPLAAALRAVLEAQEQPGEATIREFLTLAGRDPHNVTRGDYTLAGTVLRAYGWTVLRRRGGGARERVYGRAARAA